MSKTRMRYFQHEDILHITVARGPEAASVELEPNITAELNDKGELIGLEILNASKYLRDSLLESAQAKMLHLSTVPAR
ncbi:MAG: DNA polymerase III subunit alpha [Lentisphaerae bacterium RIFOXYB12_FULL_65_16]|nr:MAG: DNA polymerase III subunit alpha [Lentisphaerae bacterium RIFOXYA12_64_32]OGV92156.1 MAG: DNA polymerase III subunit alpha [Lentisphaerae bacterium RIFOXYB12_FULL_65_16]